MQHSEGDVDSGEGLGRRELCRLYLLVLIC